MHGDHVLGPEPDPGSVTERSGNEWNVVEADLIQCDPHVLDPLGDLAVRACGQEHKGGLHEVVRIPDPALPFLLRDREDGIWPPETPSSSCSLPQRAQVGIRSSVGWVGRPVQETAEPPTRGPWARRDKPPSGLNRT